MAPGILRIDEVNMTNCSKQRRRFFEKHGSMDCDLLIAYWMMAGFLNPVESVDEAYERGHDVLRKLAHEREIQSLPCGKISTPSTTTTLHPHPKQHCRHEGSCSPANIELDDLIELQGFEEVTLTNGMLKDKNGSLLLIDGNHLSEYSLGSAHRLKCIACFNSTSDASLKLLLESIDKPSVLLLRGFESVPRIESSIENLKALSVLEISTAGERGPDFEYKFKFPSLTQLKFLNLSGVYSDVLPEEGLSMLKQLRCLVLSGHDGFRVFRSLKDLPNLEVLDASHCPEATMSELASSRFRLHESKLRVLNLYGCKIWWSPPVDSAAITHLFLSRSGLQSNKAFEHLRSLEVLDLSHAYGMSEVDLSQHENLVLADLSRTRLSSIDTVSHMVHLRKLILRRCKRLKGLPRLEKLESLQVLNICGCELITRLPDLNNLGKLEQLYLSGTQVSRLPAFPNPCSLRTLSLKGLELDSLGNLGSLLSLVELDLSKVKISSSSLKEFKTDFLQSLEKLEILNLSGTSVAEIPELAKLTSLKQLSLADCPCLNTAFDVRVLVNLEKLELPLKADSSSPWKGVRTSSRPSLHKLDDKDCSAEKPSVFDRIIKDPSQLTKLTDLVSEIQTATTNFNNDDKRQLEMLRIDLEYLQRRVESLKNSPDNNTAGELLQHLMDAADSSEDDFMPNSLKLQQLLITVAKLKLLIPRTQMSIDTTRRNKESNFIISNDGKTQAEDIVKKLVKIKNPQVETALLHAYTSLTNNQRECLLCFSVFPWDTEEDVRVLTWQSLGIRKKTLIYWWVGEGFIDNDGENNVEEIGEEILKVFIEKGFMETVAIGGRETGRCLMHPFVHSFVTDQAKRSGSFDFSNENSNLTPMFTCSHRAAILKSQQSIPSSCQIWKKYGKSPEELKMFESVRTLFNVNDSVVYIQPEWFSMMKDLSVLHLGNWHSGTSEHVEFGDQKFLEELKNMKKLKLFSLRGVSAVKKLPDSLCELASLMILDLRECHELVELPACIGSLKNLTHLDISCCRLLDKLPKGVSLLSKLQVFKGFVVYKQHSSKNKVCSFRDLIKLRNLRQLSIVVNQDEFPGIEELMVLEEMLNLCKLKISWVTSSIKDERKCNESYAERQASRREFLTRIEKLKLWCFPSKTAPEWLVPEQLKNLQELHITGGELQQLHEGVYENVKTLRLRNLPNFMIKWTTLKLVFPELTYLEKYKCQKLGRFPCDDQGIWRKGVCSKDRSSSTYGRKPATFLDRWSPDGDSDYIFEDHCTARIYSKGWAPTEHKKS